MQTYTCPSCGEIMERDLSLFMDHTDRHIVDEVKKQHPAWITQDGYCPKCLDYFKRAMRDPETLARAEFLETTNIGPEGIRLRLALGVAGIGAGILTLLWLDSTGSPPIAWLILFPLFFAGCLGFLQARKKVCVVIAQKQTPAMRRAALRILVNAMILSALLTAGGFMYGQRG
jgi:hypothetical protein